MNVSIEARRYNTIFFGVVTVFQVAVEPHDFCVIGEIQAAWTIRQRAIEGDLRQTLTNMRARAYQEGDLNAQYGACNVGERHLLELLDRYGVQQVRACIAELKDMADRHMRALLREVPDGFYSGTAVLEDSGHGLGQLSITAQVEIRGDEAHILIESPPQVPYFINSYAGNSVSGVYLGLMMFAQV